MKRPLIRWPVIETPQEGSTSMPLRTRLGWMALIWAGSVTALLAVAMLLRMVLKV